MNSLFSIQFTSLAKEEYIAAFQYYESKQIGLGKQLELELDLMITQLSKNPLLYQQKYKTYREALLKKFPYFLVYEIIEKQVIIYSFFHTSRNPTLKKVIKK